MTVETDIVHLYTRIYDLEREVKTLRAGTDIKSMGDHERGFDDRLRNRMDYVANLEAKMDLTAQRVVGLKRDLELANVVSNRRLATLRKIREVLEQDPV